MAERVITQKQQQPCCEKYKNHPGMTACHSKYFAYELTRRYSSDSLQKLAGTLLDAQVDLNPHQVEAALFAFKSPLSKGALLADEVGLGKTIEAGMVISQKWAEKKRKILLIVPSNLRKQWHQELQDKFFLPSMILETSTFNREIKTGNLNPFVQNVIVICSYHFARNRDSYISHGQWDLIVIDEAHRLRNVYKPQNKIANAIKNAVSPFPKILLTATPLQNSLLELYGLISIIDDFTFGDLKSFKAQFSRINADESFADLKQRLAPVCRRTLRRQVLEYIKYTNRIAITQEFVPYQDEEIFYDLITEYLQRPTLHALPSSQRHLMTLILRKLLASSTFAIAGTMGGLAKKLEAVVHHRNSNDFEKALTENLESYDELVDEWETDEEEGQTLNITDPDILTEADIVEISHEIKNLWSFEELANSITRNAKGETLITALQKGFAETERLRGKKKAIIFTESTRTQQYLNDVLQTTEFAGKTVLFNGSNTDAESKRIYQEWLEKNKGTDNITGSATADKRAAIVDYFRDEAVIMIATEAAAEGINLQFCSLVVNYDLPWNPQRIEQRIGRCHRYGQECDVVVVNFLNKKNAADQRVYEILKDKFHLFSGVFGASDEVLGSIESGIDFEKRIAQIYQTCRTPEEIQRSFDELQKELDEKIIDQMDQTRKLLLESFDEEVTEKLRINLKESREYISRYENWLWQITKFQLGGQAGFDDNKHSFELKHNPFPGLPVYPGKYKMGGSHAEAHLYRIGCPLAQHIIEQCKKTVLDRMTLAFDYSGADKKITPLKPLLGKRGWLTAVNLTIEALEAEDHILLAGITEEGEVLDYEQCHRLFSLPAEETGQFEYFTGRTEKIITAELFSQEQEIIQHNAKINSGFFDSEMEKLEKWANDIKTSLEIRLKQLDVDIKTRKTESRKILDLAEKVKVQREIKELEKKRNEMRKNLFEAQDGVDRQKEKLIENVETRMRQNIQKNILFQIGWCLK